MDPNSYLAQIKALKNDWDDKIPDFMVDSTYKPNNYKVRSAWFFLIGAYLRLGLLEGHMPGFYTFEYKRFFKHIKETNMPHRLTTNCDISLGNHILESIIRHIEREKEYLRVERSNIFE
ncbi:MAG: hypothetical protein AABX47_07240 [Nanoarchaeota archaeon]